MTRANLRKIQIESEEEFMPVLGDKCPLMDAAQWVNVARCASRNLTH